MIAQRRHELTHTERQSSYDPVMRIIYVHFVPINGNINPVIRSSLHVELDMSKHTETFPVLHPRLAASSPHLTPHFNNTI
jgi:hypothetical protein